jgi:predicted transcriptional regulator
MDDKPLFLIPKTILSLMPPSRQQALTAHQKRSVSTASKISQISQSSESTASDFLTAKITALEDETAHIAEIKAGLDEANANRSLKNTEYRLQLDPLTTRLRSATSTLRVLKRQRKALEEDLDDAVAVEKRRRQYGPPDEGLLERPYRDTIVIQVMKTDGKKQAPNLSTKKYKKAVNAYYDVHAVPTKSFCHVLGLHIDELVTKAAHLVPKSIGPEELGHLFGDQDVVTTLPQNGKTILSYV